MLGFQSEVVVVLCFRLEQKKNNVPLSQAQDGVNTVLRLDGTFAENHITAPDALMYYFPKANLARQVTFTGGMNYPRSCYKFLSASPTGSASAAKLGASCSSWCKQAHQTIELQLYHFKPSLSINPTRESPAGTVRVSDHTAMETGHRIGWENCDGTKGEESRMRIIDNEPFLIFEFRYRPKELLNVGSHIEGLFGTFHSSENMSDDKTATSNSDADESSKETSDNASAAKEGGFGELRRKINGLIQRVESLEKRISGMEGRMMKKIEEKVGNLNVEGKK